MKPDRDAPIGLFDSGVGGLTVAREIMRNLPSEKIVYFGDTARVPYGGKSRENIIRYSRQIIHFLMEQQVKAIVIACNTASAFALEELLTKGIDSLVLGCTHYPLIRSVIREFMGEEVRLVNPAYETALELRSLLEKKELLNTGGKNEEFPYRFYVSDLAEKFRAFAGSILPYDVEMTKKIDIEKY